LFCDIAGFTHIGANVSLDDLGQFLRAYYAILDECISKFPGLYKVETIGDAYMVCGGAPTQSPLFAVELASFAMLALAAVNRDLKSPLDDTPITIRVGINAGPLGAGVLGNVMPRYCFFGDCVNVASRMESEGEPGRIQCSAAYCNLLRLQEQEQEAEQEAKAETQGKGKLKEGEAHSAFVFDLRGTIKIKGKDDMETYWLTSA